MSQDNSPRRRNAVTPDPRLMNPRLVSEKVTPIERFEKSVADHIDAFLFVDGGAHSLNALTEMCKREGYYAHHVMKALKFLVDSGQVNYGFDEKGVVYWSAARGGSRE